MAERKGLKIQLVIPEADIGQFRQDCNISGLKPTQLARLGLEAAHFIIQEVAEGSDIIAKRPDGTPAELLLPMTLQGLKRRSKSKGSE